MITTKSQRRRRKILQRLAKYTGNTVVQSQSDRIMQRAIALTLTLLALFLSFELLHQAYNYINLITQ